MSRPVWFTALLLTLLAIGTACRTPLTESEAAHHPLGQSPHSAPDANSAYEARRFGMGAPESSTPTLGGGSTRWVRRAESNRIPEPREVARTILRSTYAVTVLDARDNVVGFGSAFALAEDILMTNAHVVADNYKIRIHPVGDRSQMFVATDYSLDPRRDLALLRVPGLNATPVEVAFDSPKIGDQVYVAGNPDGLEGSFTDGLVSAYRSFEGCPPVFQMTAPIAPGSSGGAVVNQRGGVVGVAVGARGRGENLNFAVRLEELVAFAAEHGLKHSPAPQR